MGIFSIFLSFFFFHFHEEKKLRGTTTQHRQMLNDWTNILPPSPSRYYFDKVGGYRQQPRQRWWRQKPPFSEALFPLVSDDRTQHSSEARSQSFLLRQLSLNYECRCVNGIEYIWNYDASEGAIRLAESELGILFRTSNSFAESHGSLLVCWRHQHWLRMKFELFRRESENQLRMKSVEKAQFCFFG